MRICVVGKYPPLHLRNHDAVNLVELRSEGLVDLLNDSRERFNVLRAERKRSLGSLRIDFGLSSFERYLSAPRSLNAIGFHVYVALDLAR